MTRKKTKPSFMEMMGVLPTGIHPSKDGLVFDLYDEQDLDYLCTLYKKNERLLEKKGPQKIPSTLHFIWIGPKPFPEESLANVLSWKKFNPDWEILFWTDSHDRPCPVAGMKKRLVQEYDFGRLAPYIQKSVNWGEKSDLMRYVIVHDQGGFYTDHDSEALRSFEPLLQFDSVICCEEPQWRAGVNGSAILFQNGLFGAVPRHPILDATIDNIEQIWHDLDERFPDGDKPTPPWKVLRRTFNSFTLAVKSFLRNETHRRKFHDLILPTCYFFPNRILSEEDMRAFVEKGVIWSSHKYAGLWAKDLIDSVFLLPDGSWGKLPP